MGMTPEDFPTGAGNFEAVCPETFVNGNLGQSVGRWRTGFVFGGTGGLGYSPVPSRSRGLSSTLPHCFSWAGE